MDHALVIAFQNYVRTYSPELFSQLFYGFKTASLATIHQGLKGEHVVTESIVSSNLARRHRTDFDAVTAFTLKPEKLITVLNKRSLPPSSKSTKLPFGRATKPPCPPPATTCAKPSTAT